MYFHTIRQEMPVRHGAKTILAKRDTVAVEKGEAPTALHLLVVLKADYDHAVLARIGEVDNILQSQVGDVLLHEDDVVATQDHGLVLEQHLLHRRNLVVDVLEGGEVTTYGLTWFVGDDTLPLGAENLVEFADG